MPVKILTSVRVWSENQLEPHVVFAATTYTQEATGTAAKCKLCKKWNLCYDFNSTFKPTFLSYSLWCFNLSFRELLLSSHRDRIRELQLHKLHFVFIRCRTMWCCWTNTDQPFLILLQTAMCHTDVFIFVFVLQHLYLSLYFYKCWKIKRCWSEH